MVSYNNITKLTYYHENKLHDKLLALIFKLSNSTNLLNILQFIKQERFVEDNSNIKISYENKEVLIFKENFLINIPEHSSKEIHYDGFNYTIGYPSFVNFKINPTHCIKKISYKGEEHILKTQEDYNLIPARLYNNLKEDITEYINNLQSILVYKVGRVDSRFFLNKELIINIIYLAFVSSYKNLVQEQLFLMKEFNFTYDSFDKLSFLEINHYLKAGIKNINERNNSETT